MTDREKLEKIKELADAMYYAAQQLTTDASRLHKAMDEYHKFIIHEYKEEPVSEDFEISLEKKVREAQDWTYIEEEGGECPLNEEFGASDLEEFAMWGAQWQKQQMMKDAVKARFTLLDGFCIDRELYKNYKVGGKYKLIIIKED